MPPPQTLQEIFHAALDIASPTERAAFLDSACQTNTDLRVQVDRLLAAQADAKSFLELPAVLADPDLAPIPTSPTIAEAPGTVIGPYTLLQQIGEGGMGVVFMATQTLPFQRTVALKIIKPGMDSREVISRFAAERQALAMMDHPNIAKVLDAGTTHTGRPYFVMELVQGTPITRYCDEHHLTLNKRLELFLPICHAIQHAHQKGLIHRDIKPTNVLVAEYDQRPVPKVIDFGIAKATQQDVILHTVFTDLGQVVGTIEYMSPEQARLNQLDIDTRSDIYSLGVVLYELLTGSTPFARGQLKDAAFDEMLRMIREDEPPKPSTRLSSAGTPPSIAANRSVEPVRLNRLVRGELDWIAMKCLEKDRTRRYDTASALAADISQYLSGLPVSAGAPPRLHRTWRFIRRNRVAVVVTTAFALLLITTAALTTAGLLQQRRLRLDAENQRAIAESQRTIAESQRAIADSQRALADRNAAIANEQRQVAEAVTQFQNDMLKAADPQRGKGDKVTVVEVMTAAAAELDKSTAVPPAVEASVRNMIAATLRELGRPALAEPNARRALELRRTFLPPNDSTLLNSISQYGAVLLELGRIEEALTLFEQVVADSAGRNTLERNRYRHNLSVIYRQLGRYKQAELMAREVLKTYDTITNPDPRTLQAALANLGAILNESGNPTDAEPVARQALTLARQAFPPGNTAIAEAINNLASVFAMLDRLPESEPLMREALEINRKALPPTHPSVISGLANLAAVLTRLGKITEAEPFSREALELSRQVFPPNHPSLAQALLGHGNVLSATQNTAEAVILADQALAIIRTNFPPNHPYLPRALNLVGTIHATAGDDETTERLYRESLTILRANLPPDHPDLVQAISNVNAVVAARARAATQPATTNPTSQPAPK